MKRLFCLFLVAAVAFVGCTNDEDSGLDFSGEAVSFSVMELTRSAVAKDAWVDGDTFAIFEASSERSKCYKIDDAAVLDLTAADGVEPFYTTDDSSSYTYCAFHPYVSGWSVDDYKAAMSVNFNDIDYISSGDYSESTLFSFSHTQALLTFTFIAGMEFPNGFEDLTATLTIGGEEEFFGFSNLGGAESYTFSTLVNPIATADFASTDKSLVVVGYDDSGMSYPCYVDFGTTTTSWDAGSVYNCTDLAVGTFDLFYKSNTDIYEIYTAVGLQAFANLVNGGGGGITGLFYAGSGASFGITPNTGINGKLMDDIDLSSVCYKKDGTTGNDVSWNPIGDGSSENDYSGIFDGNGKEVKNLYINSAQSNQGLFGYLKGSSDSSKAEVKNLGVVGGSVTSVSNVGGVVVCAGEYSKVTGCYNTGVVTGSGNYVGGVVGMTNPNSEVTGCYNTGDVTGGGNYVGGVVGYSTSTVSNCYNTGDVTGSGNFVGGVVGHSYDSVTTCYNTGDVTTSGNFVGGIVGQIIISTTVTECYNTGKVEGYNQVGGVVGEAVGSSSLDKTTITSCYSCGAVSSNSSSYVGGVVGNVNGDNVSITYCYYDKDVATAVSAAVSGESDSSDITTGYAGLSTTDMKNSSKLLAYLNAGATTTTWSEDTASQINSGYPILTWQTSTSGN